MQQASTEFAIPQNTFSSAPAVEVRELGGGKPLLQEQMLAELAALEAEPGFEWRLETRNEQGALIDLSYQNQHGAYTRDESLQARWYWTADDHPAYSGARVVVGFGYGNVSYGYADSRALARAVRVARQ